MYAISQMMIDDKLKNDRQVYKCYTSDKKCNTSYHNKT